MAKKLLKICIILFILFVLGIVGTYFFVKSKINSPDVRKQITDQITLVTHREAEFGGIGFSLFPFSLTINEVAIKNKAGDGNFIALKELDVLVNLKNKELERLVLKEPEINVTQYADGTFNFSDMLGGSVAESATAQPEAAPEEATTDSTPSEGGLEGPIDPGVDFNVKLIQIDKARLSYTTVDESGKANALVIPNLTLELRNISLSKPIEIDLNIDVGQESLIQAGVKLSPLKTVPPDIGNLKLDLEGQVKLGNFKDLEAFMTAEQLATLPVTQLDLTWKGTGTPADGFQFDLNVQTPAVEGKNRLGMDLDTRLDVKVPEALFNDMLYGGAGGGAQAPSGDAVELNIGASLPVFVRDHFNALTLKTHIQTKNLTFDRNVIDSLDVVVELKDGKLNLNPLAILCYKGKINGNAVVDPLAYPLSYQADFKIEELDINQILAANMEKADIYGNVLMDLNISGSGITVPSLKENLIAKGEFILRDGKQVSTGGSFIDRLYLKMDNPLLLLAMPELGPKIEQAKANAAETSETVIDDVIIMYDMANGVANLTRCNIGTSDYKIKASGKAMPFDDDLDMDAQFNFSEKATLELTGGVDKSGSLPYENGGLLIPLKLIGPLSSPTPLPDLNKIIQSLTTGQAKDKAKDKLSDLFNKDKKEEGEEGEEKKDSGLGGLLGKKAKGFGGLLGK